MGTDTAATGFAGILCVLMVLGGLAPVAGAGHAPDARDRDPHRLTSHPAYANPAASDPTCQQTPAEWTPPARDSLPTEIGQLVPKASSPAAFSGAGMTVFGGMAVVSGYSGGNHLIDIRDPAEPSVLASYGDNDTRDVQMLAFPDCRLYAVHATTISADQIEIWNLTDPTSPTFAAAIDVPDGTHNAGIVPGTPILYNADSGGGGSAAPLLGPSGETRIYDLSDPHEPQLVQEWANGYSCHDLTFHIDPGQALYRAYCAGVQATQIWDLKVPTDPAVVQTIPFPHGDETLPATSVSPAAFSHWAMVSDDAETLLVGDETGGGAAPGCDAYVEAGGQSRTGPVGNLYFYDVSDETDPELEGQLSPGAGYLSTTVGSDRIDLFPTCTAHFGDIVGTRDLAVVAFYDAGLVLVDFSDPADPRIADQWTEQDAYWGAWSYQGTVYGANRDTGISTFGLAGAS